MGSRLSVLFQPMDNVVCDLKNGVMMMRVKRFAVAAVAAAVMMTMMMMVSFVHVAYVHVASINLDALSNPCYWFAIQFEPLFVFYSMAPNLLNVEQMLFTQIKDLFYFEQELNMCHIFSIHVIKINFKQNNLSNGKKIK